MSRVLPRIGGTIDQIARGLARRALSSVSNANTFATRALLKANANKLGVAYLGEGARFGAFAWDATIPWATAAYDPLEGWFLFPNNGSAGAWVRVATEGTKAEHAGCVVGSGVSNTVRGNNRAAIQAAIDICIYKKRVCGQPELPAGIIEYTGIIELGYGDVTHETHLYGQGILFYADSGQGGSGTALVHFGSINTPAINVQNAREGAGASRFAHVGSLKTAIENFVFGTNGIKYALPCVSNDFITASAWAALGGDSRYTPYAGISIDAFCGAAAATPYDLPVRPSYAPVAVYGVTGVSSAVTFNDIQCMGFNTGYVGKPNGVEGNGDFITFNRVSMVYCQWAWSVGNGQSRNLDLFNCRFALIYCAMTSTQHGARDGRFGGTITDLSGGSSAILFNVGDTSVLGNPTFINLYTESMWSWGSVAGNTIAEGSMTFLNCTQNFQLQSCYGAPAQLIDGGSTAKIIFDGGYFEGVNFIANTNMPNVEFRGTVVYPLLIGGGVTPPEYLRYAYNTFAGGFVGPLNVPIRAQRIRFIPLTLVDGALNISEETGFNYPWSKATRAYCMPIYQTQIGGVLSDTLFRNIRRVIRPYIRSWDLASNFASTPVRAGKTLTFVFNTLSDADALFYGLLPGDVLWHASSGAFAVIKSRITTTVVAELQNNIKFLDNSLFSAMSLTAGAIFSVCCRCYTTSVETIGLIVGGNATINLGSPDTTGSYLSEIANGDGAINPFFEHGVTTAAKSVVSSTSPSGAAGASTVTLNGVADLSRGISGARAALSDWVRTAIANLP